MKIVTRSHRPPAATAWICCSVQVIPSVTFWVGCSDRSGLPSPYTNDTAGSLPARAWVASRSRPWLFHVFDLAGHRSPPLILVADNDSSVVCTRRDCCVRKMNINSLKIACHVMAPDAPTGQCFDWRDNQGANMTETTTADAAASGTIDI